MRRYFVCSEGDPELEGPPTFDIDVWVTHDIETHIRNECIDLGCKPGDVIYYSEVEFSWSLVQPGAKWNILTI